jgi:hypothetical protein
MGGDQGGGDNYTGNLGGTWDIDPTQASWMAANQGTPTWDPGGNWDMTQPQGWWARNFGSLDLSDPKTIAQLRQLQGSLQSGAAGMGAPGMAGGGGVGAGSYFSPRPPMPSAQIHQGSPNDALAQYLQTLQQRQQQMRSMFLPKTAGLLGSS